MTKKSNTSGSGFMGSFFVFLGLLIYPKEHIFADYYWLILTDIGLWQFIYILPFFILDMMINKNEN